VFSSHSNEVLNQIRSLSSRIKAVVAINVNSPYAKKWPQILQIQKSFPTQEKVKKSFLSSASTIPEPQFCLLFAGPVTEYAVRALYDTRVRYPNHKIYVVTWQGADIKLRKLVEEFADSYLETVEPVLSGRFNVNYQIAAISDAFKHWPELIDQVVLRVRLGNTIVIANDVPASMIGKIGIWGHWSWKNIPWHISDALLLARGELINKLFSLPLDTAPYNGILGGPDNFTNLTGNTAESFLWGRFAASFGMRLDLIDYYRFLVSECYLLEPSYVDTVSFKHIPLFDLDFDNRFSPNQEWFQRLESNFDLELERAQSRFNSDWSRDDFCSGRVG